MSAPKQLSRSEIVARFCDEMGSEGIEPDDRGDVVASGKLERYTVMGDKRGTETGWYVLHADGIPNGQFGCNKRYGTDHAFTWKPDIKAAPISAAERAELARQMKARQLEREEKARRDHARVAALADDIWSKAKAQGDEWNGEHPYLEAKGIQACGARIGDFPVFDRDTGEIKRTHKGALLLQVRDLDENVHSIQGIVEQRAEDGSTQFKKLFLSGGAKRGHFFPIGQPKKNADGKRIFIVCEGFSTGASIHAATEHAIVVAFDSGGLLPVAEVFRAKFPDSVIIFGADDDRWTTAPVNNPGLTAATKAARAVGAVVAVPEFTDTEGRPTDFNDLHKREGAGAVEAWINAALYPAPAAEPEEEAEQAPDADLPWDGELQFPACASEAPRTRPATQEEATEQAVREVEDQAGFRVMGYQREVTYVYAYGKKQILECKTFSLSTLLQLAPLHFWEGKFPGKSNGGTVNVNQAAEFIIRTAERRGLYDPNCVRNGGAWTDAGRHVFHHGDHLTVDGKRMLVTAIRSKFVYEATLPLPNPGDAPLSDDEGRHILDIAKQFNWERNSSAALLAGWTFLAPICGALQWRPHIFLTGPAGNGKSTILRDFVHALIGESGCVYAQGNSTEAGVRQDIGSTSLPVLLDEAEKNTERETARMESILSLIRQSSTESAAKTLKGTIGGTGMKFNVRSMFCLAAIFTGLERKADIDRLSILSLKPSRGDVEASNKWEGTKELLHLLGKEDGNMRGKIMRRALDALPAITENVTVFTKAAAAKFGSQRDGDQIGTLLAGCYSLTNSAVATPEQARAMMDELDWTAHTEAADADDSESALQELMGAFVTVLGTRHSIHNLVSFALGEEVEGRSLDAKQARTELRQHGIAIDGNKLALSNSSSALKRLLAGTAFATDPRAAFSRLPGSDKNHRQLKFNGKQTRVTALPLEAIGFGGKNIASEEEVFG